MYSMLSLLHETSEINSAAKKKRKECFIQDLREMYNPKRELYE